MSRIRQDADEAPALGILIVGLLACFAGAVDASGVTILKDLFVSFMSGNTTSLGVAIGQWDVQRILLIASIVGTFVAGAAAGTILATLVEPHHLPVVVLAVAAILVIPPAYPPGAVLAMTFAMGALNAAMTHAGPVGVSITYVTGALVKLGRGLGQLLCGHAAGLTWLLQAVSWLGILCGATIATLGIAWFGSSTFLALPVAGLVLSILCWVLTRGREAIAA